jgi:hypothetical protein
MFQIATDRESDPIKLPVSVINSARFQRFCIKLLEHMQNQSLAGDG